MVLCRCTLQVVSEVKVGGGRVRLRTEMVDRPSFVRRIRQLLTTSSELLELRELPRCRHELPSRVGEHGDIELNAMRRRLRVSARFAITRLKNGCLHHVKLFVLLANVREDLLQRRRVAEFSDSDRAIDVRKDESKEQHA